MKNLDKKTLVLTCIITLLPILLGLGFYSELPARIAIHWGLNNEPNGWAGKNFFVFGIPVLMVLLQILCLLGTSRKRNPEEPLPKMMKVIVWFLPVLTMVLYIVTMAVALGNAIDIRKVVCLLLGVLFIVTGNYIPKISYNNRNMINIPAQPENESVWRVFSRMMGITFMVEGALVLVSMFFPPMVTVLAIALLVGLLIGLSFYGSSLSGKK
ncbi:MAG: DUF1648 domain-containing protein [Hespellia sp.]|nr:DUF1648 domain-containing protein [Hespellia sp.]